MLQSIVQRTEPTDVLGTLTAVAGLLGFANVVPASDALSVSLVVLGIAAVFGPRMYRRFAGQVLSGN